MPTLRRDMESRAARSMSELFVLGLLSRRRDVPVVPVAARSLPVVALHGGRMTSKRIVNVDVGGPAPREKSRVTGPKIRATPRPSRLRDLADRLLRESDMRRSSNDAERENWNGRFDDLKRVDAMPTTNHYHAVDR